MLSDRQVNEKVENLSIQLRLMTRERNELRKRLAFATHGTTFDKRWAPCTSPARQGHHLDAMASPAPVALSLSL